MESPSSQADFTHELLRLRNEVQALAHANAHAAQLMADLQEARHMETLLKANNLQLERARRLEADRGRFLELVARNQSSHDLLASLAELLRHQYPEFAVSFLLPHDGDLRHAYSAGADDALLREFVAIDFNLEPAIRHSLTRKRTDAVLQPDVHEAAGTLAAALRAHRFDTCLSVPVLNGVGRTLAVILAYRRPAHTRPAASDDPEFLLLLEQAATLLSMGLDLRGMAQRLYYQANHDELTSLPNRTFFFQKLQDTLAAAHANGTRAAVLWADLDRFKQLNDSLGHRSADLLLRMAAKRIADCAAASSQGTAMAARIGGDEFVVLMDGFHSPDAPQSLGDSILAAFREPFGFEENRYTLGISIGVALYPDHADDAEELVRNADIAMYAAKHAGRNTCMRHNKQEEASTLESFQLEFHLRRALELGELELFFQPLVASQTGRIAAFETLLRWFNPMLGGVSPTQFIPVAEATGLIHDIGRWVLEQACRHAAAWQAVQPGVRVAVNVSPAQLTRGDFSATVTQALAAAALSPHVLELELTESAVIGLEDFQRHTTALRGLGVSLSIDDFGTGYSSLSYLHNIEVDTLKIDRSFVQRLGTEPTSARLAETILAMAKTLNLQVVAEGIETEQQQQWLTDLQCDFLQGYYLYRPMRANMVEDLLRRHAVSLDSFSVLR